MTRSERSGELIRSLLTRDARLITPGVFASESHRCNFNGKRERPLHVNRPMIDIFECHWLFDTTGSGSSI